MVAVETRELVVLALAAPPTPADSGNRSSPLSAVELSQRLELGSETMADRIRLLTVLSGLEDDGLVEAIDDADARQGYCLTAAGRSQADELFASLADRRIEVRNGTSEEVPLANVDEYVPAPAIPRALARLTDDDVLYLQESVEETFVNREDEMAVLDDHLQATREGTGRAVLITGEAGVGKTALIDEWLADIDDAVVLRASCRRDRSEPFAPLRDALAGIIEGTGTTAGSIEESPFDRPAVDVRDADDLQGIRTSLYADVADCLQAIATGSEPVVFALDDLHNASEPSIDLLGFLLDHLSGAPIFLVAATRMAAVTSDHPLSSVIELVDEGRHHDRHRIRTLDGSETHSLVEVVLDVRPVPAAFGRLVYEHTGGNPLFVEEVVSTLQESGALVPDHDVYPEKIGASVPDEVRAIIDGRLGALDESGREVVSVAALLGEEFDLEHVELSATLDAGGIREYVDVLVDANVFRWTEDGTTIAFQSELFRESVVDGIPDAECDTYHRRIADALERAATITSTTSTRATTSTTADEDRDPESGFDPESTDPEPDPDPESDPNPTIAATIARHFRQAGEPDRAIDAWLEAAEHATAAYAPELALEHYEQVLAIARERDDRELLVDVVERIGDICLLVGNHERAARAFEYVYREVDSTERKQQVARKIAKRKRVWEENPGDALQTIDDALALTRDVPTTEAACRLLVERSDTNGWLGNYEAVAEDYERAVDIATALDRPVLRAQAIIARLRHSAFHQAYDVDDDLIAAGERAIEIFEREGEDRLLARALHAISMVFSDDRELSYAERAVHLCRKMGDRREALINQHNFALRLSFQCLNGKYPVEAAEEEADAVIEEARMLGIDSVRGGGYAIKGRVYWQGHYDYEQAASLFERTLAIQQQKKFTRMQLYENCHLGSVRRDGGAYERARAHGERAIELGEGVEIPNYWAWGHRLVGAAALVADEVETAVDSFDRACTIAQEDDHVHAELLARVGLIDAYLAADRPESFLEQAESIRTILTDESYRDGLEMRNMIQPVEKPKIEAHCALGRVAHRQDEHEEAMASFQTALSIAREHEDRLREARIRFEQALTHEHAGRTDEAETAREEAVSITSELDAFGTELRRRFDG